MTTKGFDFFEYHTQLAQDDVLLSYKGPLTDVLLAEFSHEIRRKLQEEDPKVGKKVFAIFMELAQNVLYYSKEANMFGNNRDKVGTLVIVNTGDSYQLMTGNLVYKKIVPELIEKCETINALDRDALREYKRELRNAPKSEESKGAGIGLVQVALTSGNRIEMRVKEYANEYAFYVIVVNVKMREEEEGTAQVTPPTEVAVAPDTTIAVEAQVQPETEAQPETEPKAEPENPQTEVSLGDEPIASTTPTE
jgi:hypothetical protein